MEYELNSLNPPAPFLSDQLSSNSDCLSFDKVSLINDFTSVSGTDLHISRKVVLPSIKWFDHIVYATLELIQAI
jgi:hypothetical protein